MKKTLLLLVTLLCGFAFLSCSGDDDEGAATSSPEKLLPSSIPVKEVDLSSVTDYVLENFGHQVVFNVPADPGEKWSASLTFDEKDFAKTFDGDIIEGEVYELGYLGDENGTGQGSLNLYVIDNLVNEAHMATLTVTYDGKTPTKTITLMQVPSGENSDDEKEETPAQKQLVGFGYDPRLGSFSSVCRKSQIFRIAELSSSAGLKYIYDDNADPDDPSNYDIIKIAKIDDGSKISYREAAGTSVAELESNYEVTLTSNGEFCGFSEEVDARSTWSHKGEENYQYAWTEVLVNHFTATLEADAELRTKKRLMINQAYNAINGISRRYATDFVVDNEKLGFENLVRDYGMYVAVKAEIGGKVTIKMEANTSNISDAFDCHAMIKAGYSGFIDVSAGADITYKDTLTKNSSSFSFTSSLVGGPKDVQTELANAIMSGFAAPAEGYKSKYDDWKLSLAKEDNCSFINLPDGYSLVPLYELVDLEREGGLERMEAMKRHFETELGKKKDLTNYGNGIPSKLDLTELSFSDTGTLVKDIYISDEDGPKRVAVACSEYIPEINAGKRVTIIYPATNVDVLWNRGLYLGTSALHPQAIAWKADYANLANKIEKTEGSSVELPKYTTVYIAGTTLSVFEPTWLSDDEISKLQECTTEDFKFNFGTNGTYDVVKIGKALFAREFYKGNYWNDGTLLDEQIFLGTGSNTVTVTHPFYRLNEWCGYGAHTHGGSYPGTRTTAGGVSNLNYTSPHVRWMEALVIRFADAAYGTRSLAGMFSSGGLIGLNITDSTSKGWPSKETSGYWYTNDPKSTCFLCIDNTTTENPWLLSEKNASRFYISDSGVGVLRDGFSGSFAYMHILLCAYLV